MPAQCLWQVFSHLVADFVSVHVSGLPPHCDDAAVEAELRQALDASAGHHGMLSLLDAGVCTHPSSSQSHTQNDILSDVKEVTPTRETLGQDNSQPTMSPQEDEDKEGEGRSLLSDSCYSCTLPRKRNGESKGFCFLEFENLESAEAAVLRLNAGVQVLGCMISAQIAKQSGTTVSQQANKHQKSKAKQGRAEERLPDLKIKRQGYSKNAASALPPPPLRKNNARPLNEEKKASTYLKSLGMGRTVVPVSAALSLEDGDQALQLTDADATLDIERLAIEDK
eukprot:TRINITY_DN19596_c0_g1_i1.p1 TRINITY_DN19596_c0_g1~~TRINITY_DN19596_c0_g1_i1.p1  ORF type:complete len:281 (-),score=37.16 TRINITY_DN19596_c0_g1_i1:292-1134(-)